MCNFILYTPKCVPGIVWDRSGLLIPQSAMIVSTNLQAYTLTNFRMLMNWLGILEPFSSLFVYAISLCFFFVCWFCERALSFFSSNFLAIVATGTVASSDSLRSSPKVDVLQPSGVPHDSGTLSFHSYLILVMKLAPFNSFVCEEYF